MYEKNTIVSDNLFNGIHIQIDYNTKKYSKHQG